MEFLAVVPVILFWLLVAWLFLVSLAVASVKLFNYLYYSEYYFNEETKEIAVSRNGRMKILGHTMTPKDGMR